MDTIYGSLPQLLPKLKGLCTFKACPAVAQSPGTPGSVASPQLPLHPPTAANSEPALLSPV